MDYTLERFISFCDEMKIADESLHSLKAENNIMKKRLDLLKIQLKRAHGDYDKQSSIIDEIKNIVQNYISKIEKMNDSEFGNNIGKVQEVIGMVCMISGVLLVIPTLGLAVPVLILPGMKLTESGTVNQNFRKTALDDLKKELEYLDKVKTALKESYATEADTSIYDFFEIADEGAIQRMKDRHTLRKDIRAAGYRDKKSFKKDADDAKDYMTDVMVKKYERDHKIPIGVAKKIITTIQLELNKILNSEGYSNHGDTDYYGKRLTLCYDFDLKNDSDWSELHEKMYSVSEKILSKNNSLMKKNNIDWDLDYDPDVIFALELTVEED